MIRKPIHENDPPSLAMVDMLRADHQQAAAGFLLVSFQLGSVAELALADQCEIEQSERWPYYAVAKQ